jgi:hypothetical protein
MWVHSQLTNEVLGALAGATREPARVVVRDGGFVVVTGLRSANGFPLARELAEVYVPSFNLVLFAALLLGVPVRYVRRSWKYLVVATVALFLTQSAFYTARVLFSVVDIYAENGQRYLPDAAVALLRVSWRTWGIALVDAIPFVLFAPVFLRREGGGGARRSASDRNAPCPCGSGRKFKRCCGATR